MREHTAVDPKPGVQTQTLNINNVTLRYDLQSQESGLSKSPRQITTITKGVGMNHLIIPFFLLPATAAGQSIMSHGAIEIPFASAGHVIELTIENASSIPQSSITVNAAALPAWLTLEPREYALGALPGRTGKTARFMFAVEKAAPVNTDHTLTFTVNGSPGQTWSKGVTIRIAPPASFELFQNYPNPFNPTTSIAYQLPLESRVRLVIYDLLGKEVSTLVDGHRSAGYHQVEWDASDASSGLYVCRIMATGHDGREMVRNRMMMLVR